MTYSQKVKSMLKYQIVPVTPYVQNCSIVWCDQTMSAAVIDPGGDVPRIKQAAQQLGVHIEQIWITHGHSDHAAGAALLARELNVPIYGPQEDDLFLLEMLADHKASMAFWDGVEPFIPTRWLHDMDTVSIGHETLTVRHCPGHTPGHVVFHSASAKRAFVGDVLFAGSIGRTDFPRGNHEQLIASIVGKLWPMGDDTVFISGHGPESTFGQERRTNPFVGGT